MYITAARHDDVIPFEGVKKYVEKLQHCIKEYGCSANSQMVEYCASLQTGVSSISNLVASV